MHIKMTIHLPKSYFDDFRLQKEKLPKIWKRGEGILSKLGHQCLQLIAAEEERTKWEEVLEETRKDVDIALKSLRAAEKLGDDVLAQVKDCNHKVLYFFHYKSSPVVE